jgi:hypothetical protein
MTDSDATTVEGEGDGDGDGDGDGEIKLTDLQELAAKLLEIGDRRDPNNEENAKFYEELGASVAAQKSVLSGYVQRSR